MSLLELVTTFLFYTIITFGNGSVMFPLLEEELVQQHHFLSGDQLLYAFAISRVTPGQPNMYIANLGFLTFGIFGAIFSALSILIPSFLMIPLLRGYEKMKEFATVNNFVKGITVTSVGILFSSVVSIGEDVLISPISWIVFFAMIFLSKVTKKNGFVCLILASILGLGIEFVIHA